MQYFLEKRQHISISWFFIRKVTKFGNSAKVDCPKEYIDRTVYLVIVWPLKPIDTAALANLKHVATAVKPYMNTVRGLYFHGSRARGDYRKDSDYDLVLITSDKIDDELKIELKEHNILVEANWWFYLLIHHEAFCFLLIDRTRKMDQSYPCASVWSVSSVFTKSFASVYTLREGGLKVI